MSGISLVRHSGKSWGILVSLEQSLHDVSSRRDVQETSSNLSREILSENFDTFARKNIYRFENYKIHSIFNV